MDTPVNPTVSASKGLRVLGYLIDILPAIFIGLFALIPIVGPIISGMLLTPYWLLRDIFGRSLGKMVVGTSIVDGQGKAPAKGALILRNVPLAIGPAVMIIPLLGYVGPFIAFIIFLIEVVSLFAQGHRIGDKMAGTVVVQATQG